MFTHTAIKLLFTNTSELIEVTNHISAKHPTMSKTRIAFDIIWSSLRYGTNYTEYEALNYFERTGKNKATYLTVLYWLVWLKKLNPVQYRKSFRDKRIFNETFEEFTKREWIDLTKSSEEQIKRFIDHHSNIVLKKSSGSSGKQVLVVGGVLLT